MFAHFEAENISMNIEVELIKVSDLQSQVLQHFGDFARDISADHTAEYRPLDENVRSIMVQSVRMLLDSSEGRRQQILSTSKPSLQAQFADMILNTLNLCYRAKQYGWETIVVPKDRATLYAGIDPQLLERINRDSYASGDHARVFPISISSIEGLN